MNETVSRRVFVGSVAAGIPLVVGGTRGALAQSPTTQAHAHPPTDGTPDAMFEHAITELAALSTRIQRRGATAEDVRLAAAHLGALAAYGQQIDMDTPTRQATRDLIRTKGRDAVLAQDIDTSRARARLKQYGVNADERWFDTHKSDHDTRVKALDGFAQQGITGLFAHLSSTFERIGSTLDSHGGSVGALRLVQLDEAWKAGFCAQLGKEIQRLEAEATIVCGIAWFYISLEAVCAVTMIALGIQMSVYVAYCR